MRRCTHPHPPPALHPPFPFTPAPPPHSIYSGGYAPTIGDGAAVYLSAVLKSIAASFLNEAAVRAKTSKANVSDSDGGGAAAAAAAADAAPRIDPAHIQAALMGNRELQRLIVTMTSGGSCEALLHSIHNVYIDCLSTQRAYVNHASYPLHFLNIQPPLSSTAFL